MKLKEAGDGKGKRREESRGLDSGPVECEVERLDNGAPPFNRNDPASGFAEGILFRRLKNDIARDSRTPVHAVRFIDHDFIIQGTSISLQSGTYQPVHSRKFLPAAHLGVRNNNERVRLISRRIREIEDFPLLHDARLRAVARITSAKSRACPSGTRSRAPARLETLRGAFSALAGPEAAAEKNFFAAPAPLARRWLAVFFKADMRTESSRKSSAAMSKQRHLRALGGLGEVGFFLSLAGGIDGGLFGELGLAVGV